MRLRGFGWRPARRVTSVVLVATGVLGAVLATGPWRAAARGGHAVPAPSSPIRDGARDGARDAPAEPAPGPTPAPVPDLVPWHGPVEHIFFHTLVIRPQLAFTRDRLAQGFRDWFITAGEFKAIVAQLYANGWTLVDIHRAVAGAVRVPPGRKPLVLSEDDVNYYDYSRPRGLGWRLVLDPAGNVMVEVRDGRGVRVTDEDLVPLVDEFVASHPDFSADGAKGVLALTGYEGVFGERTQDRSSPDWPTSVARATTVAQRLKATGWTLASHSYGHIDLTRDSTSWAAHDTARWLSEVEPITGPTDVYVYPFGAAPIPGSPSYLMLRDAGFTIQCDIDDAARTATANGVTVMSRRHIDGIAFRDQVRNLAPFFSVAAVEDAAARKYEWPRTLRQVLNYKGT